ncbi:hypothetical protein [Caudoviricetes sp.]|nr:hypothetical protein [Caudoviricetes sp.]
MGDFTDISQLFKVAGFGIRDVAGQKYVQKLIGDGKIARFVDIAGQILTAQITDANVTYAKIANATALSVLGRASNSAGVLADIAAGTDGHVLRQDGTALGFGQLALGAFPDSLVTPNKLAPREMEIAISGTSTGTASLFTLTQTISNGTWPAISSNAQVVPEAGLYEISASGRVTCTSANSPQSSSFDLYLNGVLSAPIAFGYRYSSTITHELMLAPMPKLVRFTTPASEAISIRQGLNVTAVSGCRLRIRKVAI